MFAVCPIKVVVVNIIHGITVSTIGPCFLDSNEYRVMSRTPLGNCTKFFYFVEEASYIGTDEWKSGWISGFGVVYSKRHFNLLFRQLFLVFLVFDDRQVSGLASFCGELWDWCLVNAEVQVFVFSV